MREKVTATEVIDRDLIRQAVLDAELPPLLAALAQASGDLSILTDDVRPVNRRAPLPEPQGGMSPEAQARAREVAVEKVAELMQGNRPAEHEVPLETLRAIITFLIGPGHERYLPLLEHELALPSDSGRPTWNKDDIAPDRNFRVAIIGAGASGLAAALRMQQAGVPFVVFEKNPDIGGTWFENVYPGCRLDTSNFAYGYSFAQDYAWPDRFSTRESIFEYLSQVCDDASLRSDIRFGSEVVRASYSDTTAEWKLTVRTESGTYAHTCNAIVAATGQLNRPKYPDIPGRERFRGEAMHSAQWDRSVELDGRRVAVIGTGASAYQIVPAIAGDVSQLTVFQRSAPWMMPTPNYEDPLPPGFVWLLANIRPYARWVRFWQFWNSTEGRLPYVIADPNWSRADSVSAENDRLRQLLLHRVGEQYTDRPDLLPHVTPNYPPGGKRMLRDSGAWAVALKRANVHLETAPIQQITETAIVTEDGTRHEVDVIVFATGFRASEFLEPIDVIGSGGTTLRDYWAGDARAYLGITIPQFPNLFLLYGPNTNTVVNGSATFFAESAVEYSMSALELLLRGGWASMSGRQDVLDAFIEELDLANAQRAWGVGTVSSWYKNKLGRVSQVWPYDLLHYWTLTREAQPHDYELQELATT